MTQPESQSTDGYTAEAPRLFEVYESLAFETVHACVLHLIPSSPCDVLDIGSGTGRDAAWFAAQGHRVTAVEPTAAMREGAIALHASPRIEWLDDRLPELPLVTARGAAFDVVMLSAVWMHFNEPERRRAMATVAPLVRAGGVLLLSLRDGPVPSGRRMFHVPTEETIGLAAEHGLDVVLNVRKPSRLRSKPEVRWDRLAFVRAPARPDLAV